MVILKDKTIKQIAYKLTTCFSLALQFIEGEPVYKGSCRTNIGGYHVTDYLKQLLSLKHPLHM